MKRKKIFKCALILLTFWIIRDVQSRTIMENEPIMLPTTIQVNLPANTKVCHPLKRIMNNSQDILWDANTIRVRKSFEKGAGEIKLFLGPNCSEKVIEPINKEKNSLGFINFKIPENSSNIMLSVEIKAILEIKGKNGIIEFENAIDPTQGEENSQYCNRLKIFSHKCQIQTANIGLDCEKNREKARLMVMKLFNRYGHDFKCKFEDEDNSQILKYNTNSVDRPLKPCGGKKLIETLIDFLNACNMNGCKITDERVKRFSEKEFEILTPLFTDVKNKDFFKWYFVPFNIGEDIIRPEIADEFNKWLDKISKRSIIIGIGRASKINKELKAKTGNRSRNEELAENRYKTVEQLFHQKDICNDKDQDNCKFFDLGNWNTQAEYMMNSAQLSNLGLYGSKIKKSLVKNHQFKNISWEDQINQSVMLIVLPFTKIGLAQCQLCYEEHKECGTDD